MVIELAKQSYFKRKRIRWNFNDVLSFSAFQKVKLVEQFYDIFFNLLPGNNGNCYIWLVTCYWPEEGVMQRVMEIDCTNYKALKYTCTLF